MRIDADGHETLFSSAKAEEEYSKRMDKVDAFVVRLSTILRFKLPRSTLSQMGGAAEGGAEGGAVRGAEGAAGALQGEQKKALLRAQEKPRKALLFPKKYRSPFLLDLVRNPPRPNNARLTRWAKLTDAPLAQLRLQAQNPGIGLAITTRQQP